jgi:hypothetical protein
LTATGRRREQTEHTEQTERERSRVLSQTTVIHGLEECLGDRLSDAQRAYVRTRTEYGAQRYLFALVNAESARCARLNLEACERLWPGECIASPGEVEGRQP